MAKSEFIFIGSYDFHELNHVFTISYSQVDRIFNKILMDSQYKINGFPNSNSWVHMFFMNNIHTTLGHIHVDGTCILFPKQLS